MPAPQAIIDLVQQFDQHRDQYRNGAFTEVAVRHQFIDPFFMALGWDVNNTQGFAEQYKEVVHEDKVKIGDATKAPDYSFRLGPARMFFVEAKKPAVDINRQVEPAYQLRRYAWSAKLPVSILTDFEELSVYDCRSKPDHADKASTGRILYLPYTKRPASSAASTRPIARSTGSSTSYTTSPATRSRWSKVSARRRPHSAT